MKYYEFVRWGFCGELFRVRKYEYEGVLSLDRALEEFEHSITLRNVMSSLLVDENGKVIEMWVR